MRRVFFLHIYTKQPRELRQRISARVKKKKIACSRVYKNENLSREFFFIFVLYQGNNASRNYHYIYYI